jgi:hypothetical protein
VGLLQPGEGLDFVSGEEGAVGILPCWRMCDLFSLESRSFSLGFTLPSTGST